MSDELADTYVTEAGAPADRVGNQLPLPGQLSLIPPRLDPARPLPGRHHHDGQPTELLAAALVTPRSGTQRAAVLKALEVCGDDGATDYELWHLYGIGARPHVPATRREELIGDGWSIRDSGRRRLTDTGTPAIVWALVPEPPR